MQDTAQPAHNPAVPAGRGRRGVPPLLRRFLRGAFWSVVASLAARGLPVIASLVVAGMLGRAEYGELGVVQNTLQLFTVLSTLGLGLSATRFVAAHRSTDPGLAAIYAGLAMRITLGAGGFLAVLTFFAAPVLARSAFGDATLELPLRLAAPIVIFSAINGAQMGILTGLEAYRSLALAGVAQGVLTAGILIAGVLIGGVTGAVVALAIAEATSAGILRLAVRRAMRESGTGAPGRATGEHWRTLLRFSIPALISSSLTLPAALIGTILLTRQPDGLGEMGLYSAASRWSFAVLFLPTAVSRIVLPMLANLDGVGNRTAFRRIFYLNLLTSTAVVAIPAMAVILLANPLMGLLGEEYRLGGTVLIVLLLATIPITLNEVIGQVLVSTGAILWRLAFDIALAGLLIGLAVVFVPRWQAEGLAATQIVGYGAVSLGLVLVVTLRLRGEGRLPVTATAPSMAPAEPTSGLPAPLLPEPAMSSPWAAAQTRKPTPWLPLAPEWDGQTRLGGGLVGCVLMAWVGVLWFCAAMPDPPYLAALVPAIGMPLVLALLPACRLRPSTPLCPHNWVLFVFTLQILILPLVANTSGIVLGQLPFPPSDGAINQAILISFVAFVAYCLAFQWSNRRGGGGRVVLDERRPERRPPHRPLGLAFAGLGLLGFLLAFGSPAGLIQYYLSPADDALIPDAAAATLSEAASTFLRPFLGIAIVLFWALWADRRGPAASTGRRLAVTVGAALALIVVYASFGYNRGAFAAPMLALVAAYSMRVRKVPFRVLLIGGTVGLTLLLAWGLYRTSTYGGISEIATNPQDRAAISEDLSLNESLQIYGGGPQLTAFVLDNRNAIPPEYLGGNSLLGSLLSPVPVIGEPFREASGVLLFNRLIYGLQTDAYDQVLPFQAELYVNFGLGAVIVVFLGLGLVFARLERAFQTSVSSAQTFMIQYTATWLAFLIPGSLAATSQIFIYFFWPIYLYLGLRFIGWRSERNAPRPVTLSHGGAHA